MIWVTKGHPIRLGSLVYFSGLVSVCKELGVSVRLSSDEASKSGSGGDADMHGVSRFTWVQQLPWVEYALPSFALGCCPFKVAYGYQPPLLKEQWEKAAVPSVRRLISKCHTTRRMAWEFLLWGQEHSKRYANKKHTAATVYKLGNRVWLSTPNLKWKGTNKKLAPWFIGPFKIIT